MKKAFLSMMMLALALYAWAQAPQGGDNWKAADTVKPAKLTLIPKVGLNWATTSLDTWVAQGAIDKPDISGVIGPVGGVELEYRFSDLICASAGVLYAMQGQKYDDTDASRRSGLTTAAKNATVRTERHHYINIPLTANFYVAPGLALRTGVQMGLLFWKSGTADWPNNPEWNELSLGSSPKKFDLSIPVGISYALKNNLQFDLRYNHGLTKVAFSEDIKGKSRSVQLTVGYRLDLMK